MAKKLRYRLREKMQRMARKLPFLGPLLVAVDQQNLHLLQLQGALASQINQQAFVAREQLRMASPRCAEPLRLCAVPGAVVELSYTVKLFGLALRPLRITRIVLETGQ